jgi:hypothetical protein
MADLGLEIPSKHMADLNSGHYVLRLRGGAPGDAENQVDLPNEEAEIERREKINEETTERIQQLLNEVEVFLRFYSNHIL